MVRNLFPISGFAISLAFLSACNPINPLSGDQASSTKDLNFHPGYTAPLDATLASLPALLRGGQAVAGLDDDVHEQH